MTGGAGFIGSAVCRYLVAEQNAQLLNIDKLTYAANLNSLEPDTEVLYKVTDYYAPECDKGLAWNDTALGIDWPVDPEKVILSDKDAGHPTLSELPTYFRYTA